MPDLLLELLSEEIPARMQAAAAADLKRLVTDGLVERGLTYAEAASFVTPRRLTLVVTDLTAHSRETREERKGPRTDAPEAAIEGFLRSTGLTRDQLEIRPDKKAQAFFAVTTRPGRPAAQIVAETVEAVVRAFPWPKSMRWGSGSLRWVRPLQSILCTLATDAGSDVVPFEIDGVAAGDLTRGHRFMSPDPLVVTTFEDYAGKLRRAHVLIDPAERADRIAHDASQLAFAQGLEVVEDPALLTEIAGLVEWPVTLMGRIEDRFLTLPPEVLQTSMKTHQKFLSVRNPATGRIEAYVTVANRETADHGATILAGNARVLAARLSDAAFFWENDLATPLEEMAAKLAAVTFHNKLGTQADRIARIAALAREIAPHVGADPDLADRAARLAKADLASAMVYEFPELQGVMGRYYAERAGEPPEVAAAAAEHYSPLGPSDRVPAGPLSVVVALADKLDTLTGFWAVNEKPSGSKDPFALRRAGLGIIRTIIDKRLSLSLQSVLSFHFMKHLGIERLSLFGDTVGDIEAKEYLFDDFLTDYIADEATPKAASEGLAEVLSRAFKTKMTLPEAIYTGLDTCGAKTIDLLAFLHDRLKVYLRDHGIRHDVIDACLAMPQNDDLTLVVARARALQDFLATDDGANLLQGFKRANNILTAEEKKDGVEYSLDPHPALAETDAERALFAALDQAEAAIAPAVEAEDFAAAMTALAALRAPIDAFFETTVVNADSPILRRNRLCLLHRIPHGHEPRRRLRRNRRRLRPGRKSDRDFRTMTETYQFYLHRSDSGLCCSAMKPEEIAPAPSDAVIALDTGVAVRDGLFGRRAYKIARLTELGLPTPPGVALSFDCVRNLAGGGPMPTLPLDFGGGRLFALYASPEDRAWGGPASIRNVGLNQAMLPGLGQRIGEVAAYKLMCGFVQSYAVAVVGLEPEDFEAFSHAAGRGRPELDTDALRRLLDAKLALYAQETGAPFPEDPMDQVEGAARAIARAWNAASARILREARGAPPDAGLGIIVQEHPLGTGAGLCGAGQFQTVDSRSGAPAVTIAFTPTGGGAPLDAAALAAEAPRAHETLQLCARTAALGLGEAFAFDFALADGRLAILDAAPVRRNARASVRIAVDLANSGAISRNQAMLRVDPRNLIEHLHPQIDPAAARDVFATGLGASPGAATGRLVLTADAAQQAAAQGEATILVRVETSPEDIRGMHAAKGVLTIRGGMSSHAAVIARGLGLPCVVGAGDLRLDADLGTVTTPDGRTLRAGALITIDGSKGQVMVGAPPMIAAELGGAFSELLEWADAVRDLGVRANADTPAEARMAREFRVDGIGLCRTEHMFFDECRITVMREMILADTREERRAALERLLPMQRDDFCELFEIMRGLPVTIRLLDPPLHEFLPHGPEGMAALAAAMNLPETQVRARARELSEVNPMLGMRGVRLGVVMPEIYEMQARAIFEAAIIVNRHAKTPVVPEVMIPLVSANREVELVKARIDAIAEKVRAEQGEAFAFKLGVMVETPRAALRAGDLAASTAFLSFGTNDLTQMTYGLSRDDAGRFMRDYVNQGVFHEDPFHVLDVEGVGELMLIAARRGRERNASLTLGLCGEHGGDPASVRFCKLAGFDYVSCSPYRVPIARLAAAQATILARGGAESRSPA